MSWVPPRRVTSTTTTVNVSAPPASAWAPGALTGTNIAPTAGNGWTWTPERDANNVVKLASWNTVPTGTWVKVAGTDIDALLTRPVDGIQALMGFAYDPDGNGTLMSATADNWNGLIEDHVNQRLWYMNAGGHNGGADNGIYRFDCFKMRWAVEHLPSDNRLQPIEYRNRISPQSDTYTPCHWSNVEYLSRRDSSTPAPLVKYDGGNSGVPVPTTPAQGNCWYWDELYWDRKPTSRHTYSAQAYDPVNNLLISSVRQRIWIYNINTGQYTMRRMFNDEANPAWGGAGGWATFDEDAGEYLFGSSAVDGYNVSKTAGYLVNSHQYTVWNGPMGGNNFGSVCRYGREFSFVGPMSSWYSDVGRYYRYNLNTRQLLSGAAGTGEMAYGSGLTKNDFGATETPALCYVPGENRYWYFAVMANNTMSLKEIDPTTPPWTINNRTWTGAVPTPAVGDNICRKMLYMPGPNAVVVTYKSTQPMFIYKF